MNRFARWLALGSVAGLCLVGCSSDATVEGTSGAGSPGVVSTGPTSTSPQAEASGETGPMALPAGRLEGGTYVVDLDAPGSHRYPDVLMTVPDTGWESLEDGFGVGHHIMGVSVWDVDQVFTRPCTRKVKVQPGPTVHDLVQALETAQLRHAKRPADVEVDGVPRRADPMVGSPGHRHLGVRRRLLRQLDGGEGLQERRMLPVAAGSRAGGPTAYLRCRRRATGGRCQLHADGRRRGACGALRCLGLDPLRVKAGLLTQPAVRPTLGVTPAPTQGFMVRDA